MLLTSCAQRYKPQEIYISSIRWVCHCYCFFRKIALIWKKVQCAWLYWNCFHRRAYNVPRCAFSAAGKNCYQQQTIHASIGAQQRHKLWLSAQQSLCVVMKLSIAQTHKSCLWSHWYSRLGVRLPSLAEFKALRIILLFRRLRYYYNY